MTESRSHGITESRNHGMTDRLKTVYPPKTSFCGGYNYEDTNGIDLDLVMS